MASLGEEVEAVVIALWCAEGARWHLSVPELSGSGHQIIGILPSWVAALVPPNYMRQMTRRFRLGLAKSMIGGKWRSGMAYSLFQVGLLGPSSSTNLLRQGSRSADVVKGGGQSGHRDTGWSYKRSLLVLEMGPPTEDPLMIKSVG